MSLSYQDEERIGRLLAELVGNAEIYGLSANEDETEIQARIFSDDAPYLYSFRLDPDTGRYVITSIQPLGQQKL